MTVVRLGASMPARATTMVESQSSKNPQQISSKYKRQMLIHTWALFAAGWSAGVELNNDNNWKKKIMLINSTIWNKSSEMNH